MQRTAFIIGSLLFTACSKDEVTDSSSSDSGKADTDKDTDTGTPPDAALQKHNGDWSGTFVGEDTITGTWEDIQATVHSIGMPKTHQSGSFTLTKL